MTYFWPTFSGSTKPTFYLLSLFFFSVVFLFPWCFSCCETPWSFRVLSAYLQGLQGFTRWENSLYVWGFFDVCQRNKEKKGWDFFQGTEAEPEPPEPFSKNRNTILKGRKASSPEESPQQKPELLEPVHRLTVVNEPHRTGATLDNRINQKQLSKLQTHPNLHSPVWVGPNDTDQTHPNS